MKAERLFWTAVVVVSAVALPATLMLGCESPPSGDGNPMAEAAAATGVEVKSAALTDAQCIATPSLCAWEGGPCGYYDVPAAHEILVLHTTQGNPFDLRCRKWSTETTPSWAIAALGSVTAGSDNSVSWFKSGSSVKAQLFANNNFAGGLCNLQTGFQGVWTRIKTETYQGNTFTSTWCQGAGFGVSNDGASSIQVAQIGVAYQH